MRTARFRIAPLVAALGLAALATGLPAADEAPQITIYNQDFALVREVRTLRLKEGENEARLGGVAGLLEPESVVLRGDRWDNLLRVSGCRVRVQGESGADRVVVMRQWGGCGLKPPYRMSGTRPGGWRQGHRHLPGRGTTQLRAFLTARRT